MTHFLPGIIDILKGKGFGKFLPNALGRQHHLAGDGSLFIFEDATGYGDFRLVHSTAPGEIFDKDWDAKVKDENLEIY